MNSVIPSLITSRKYIDDMNFDNIINKITRTDTHLTNIKKVWSSEKATHAVEDYKKFLFLKRKHIADNYYLPPTADIDEIWHHHILDTRQYHQDCQAIFGEYLHHCPYFGLRGKADFQALLDAFEITQQVYFDEFGDYLWEYEESADQVE